MQNLWSVSPIKNGKGRHGQFEAPLLAQMTPIPQTNDEKMSLHSTMSSLEQAPMVSRAISFEDSLNKERVLWQRILVSIVCGPTLLIDALCKYIIPLTNFEDWNDYKAMMSCVTAPVFMQYSFGFISVYLKLGQAHLPILAITVLFGICMGCVTYWRVRLKYGNEHSNVSNKHSMDSSVRSRHTTFSNNTCINYKLKRQFNVEESYANIQQKPVLKIYFVILGFFASVSMIAFIADELVNILTTFGVIFSIDLTL